MCRSDKERDVRLKQGKGSRRKTILTLEHLVVGQLASSAMESHS